MKEGRRANQWLIKVKEGKHRMELAFKSVMRCSWEGGAEKEVRPSAVIDCRGLQPQRT